MPETDLSTLLALQHQIDQRLLYGQSSNSGEQLVSDRYFFPDLIVAAHLIRLSWPDGSRYASSTWLANLIDRHVSAHAARRYASEPDGRAPITWDAPEDPTETAALLVAASTLLGHEERNDAGITNRVQPLAASAFSRNAANIGASLRRMDVSPAVARALLRHSLGFYSAGGHRHARQHIPSRQSHFGINHVPALLPHTWLSGPFDELLYRWASQTDWKVRHLRRVTALKLAEMSGGGTWPDCAKALRIPWNTAQQSLKVVRQELNSRDLWPDLEQAIECVANKLDCGTGRIDYGRRRELLSSWQVPADDWVKLCRGLHQGGQGNTSPTSDTATVLIWTYVTQGDHLHSPLLGALRESNSTTRLLVASINQLCTPAHRKGSKRELLHRLQTYSDTIATACDRPVTSLQTRDIELAVHLSRATTP